MGSVNKVILVGRLGVAPELRQSANGQPWMVLRLATDHRRKSGDDWVNETEWHDVNVGGATAELCHRMLRKGSQIAVDGRLSTSKWTDAEGKAQYRTRVRSHDIRFLSDFGRQSDAASALAGSSAEI